jgi:hypothetical protein
MEATIKTYTNSLNTGIPSQSTNPLLLQPLNFLRFIEGTVKNALRLLDKSKPLLIPDIR